MRTLRQCREDGHAWTPEGRPFDAGGVHREQSCECGTTRTITADGKRVYQYTADYTGLPQRMREAADTLVEATKRYHNYGVDRGEVDPELQDWRPANLRYIADEFEKEEEL
jgi:hypothetical protein